MMHYALAITHEQRLTRKQKNAIKRACTKYKLKHSYWDELSTAAKALSSFAGVLRVTATCVNEHSVGVWRKGENGE